MVIVEARVVAKSGKRDAFIKAAQPSIAATRKEKGCMLYELYASTENADALLYFEKWSDRAALDSHMKSAHMAEFAVVKKEQDLADGDAEVMIFDIVG